MSNAVESALVWHMYALGAVRSRGRKVGSVLTTHTQPPVSWRVAISDFASYIATDISADVAARDNWLDIFAPVPAGRHVHHDRRPPVHIGDDYAESASDWQGWVAPDSRDGVPHTRSVHMASRLRVSRWTGAGAVLATASAVLILV